MNGSAVGKERRELHVAGGGAAHRIAAASGPQLQLVLFQCVFDRALNLIRFLSNELLLHIVALRLLTHELIHLLAWTDKREIAIQAAVVGLEQVYVGAERGTVGIAGRPPLGRSGVHGGQDQAAAGDCQ